jgi:hypothetical protein
LGSAKLIKLFEFYRGTGDWLYRKENRIRCVITIGPYGSEWAQTVELKRIKPPCGATTISDSWDLETLWLFFEALVRGNVVLCFKDPFTH